MPFNLIIFPLVGGYYFIANSEWFKYTSQRLQSERLLFNSVIAGTILIVASYAIKFAILKISPDLIGNLRPIIPINGPYSGVAVTSFLLGISFTHLANLFIDEANQIEKAIDKIGNDLEKLLKESLEESILIQITLTNEKVYVGFCKKIPIPDRTSYITIIPVLSGYRHPENKVLEFTTHYFSVYSEYVAEGKIKAIDDLDVSLVIKCDSILNASLFDLDMYERFNKS